jgi:hypothetical protein
MDDLQSTPSISKGSVMSTVEELDYSKFYAVYVPRMSTDAHKAARKAIITDGLHLCDIEVHCEKENNGCSILGLLLL